MPTKQKGKIYIFGQIGGGGNVNAEWITYQINYLVNEKGIEQFIVYINSPGGSYFDALAIYNLLSGYDCEVRIVSQAVSAAAFIAMAGKVVKAADNASFLVHKPLITPEDTNQNADDFAKLSAELKKVGKSMVEAMMDKTGKTEKQIEKILKKDSYMSAQEAKELGFIDEIVSNKQISREVEAYVKQEPSDNISITENKQKDTQMDLKETIKALGMAEDSTEEQVLAKITELKALEKPPVDPVVDPPAEEDETPIDALTKRIDNMETTNIEAKINTLVDGAVADGKIKPAEKKVYIAAAETDFEGTKASIDAMKKNSATPVNLETPGHKDANAYVDPNQSCTDFIKAERAAGK